MSGLGSPHIRGDGQPRAAKGSWRESAGGCAYGSCMVVAALVGLGAAVAVLVGIDTSVAWLAALPGPRLAGALMGVFLTVFSGWTLVLIAAGGWQPGATVVRKVVGVAVWVLCGLLGFAMLIAAFAGATGGSAF